MEENEVKTTTNEVIGETNANPNVENVTNQNTTNTSSAASTENTANVNNEKKVNVSCLLSFIFSMVGILCFGMFMGLAATILGIVGLTTFKPDTQQYKWMGVTGLAVGAVEFVVMTLYFFVNMSSALSLL